MSASEAAVQTAIRVRASELGIKLFRNNVGACVDDTGRMIRYGLANDSAQMQKRFKSSDLIGWMTRRVAGLSTVYVRQPTIKVAVIVSIECKRSDWQGGYPNPIDPSKFNDREQAQARWIEIVRADGGIAGFARCVEEFECIVGQ